MANTEDKNECWLQSAELRHLFTMTAIPFAKEFRRLQDEAWRHPECFNQPDREPPNVRLLYDLASQANLINVAREMARSWGEDDSDGPLRGFDRLRCWPHPESRGPHALRLSFGVNQPRNMILQILPLDQREPVEIRDHNNRLVLSTQCSYIRPGDWISALVTEYNRFRLWRIEVEENPGLPKPVRPLPLQISTALAPVS